MGEQRGEAPVGDERDGESDYPHHRPRLSMGWVGIVRVGGLGLGTDIRNGGGSVCVCLYY